MKYSRIIVAAGLISLSASLSGCVTSSVNSSAAGPAGATVIVRTQYEVVHPPKRMYYCPTLKAMKKQIRIAQLTDVDVARVIERLYKNNEICRNSLEAIRKYLAAADRVTHR